MKIETKFNPGQYIFYFDKNSAKILERRITRVIVSITQRAYEQKDTQAMKPQYAISGVNGEETWFKYEDEIFATKDECIKAVVKNL